MDRPIHPIDIEDGVPVVVVLRHADGSRLALTIESPADRQPPAWRIDASRPAMHTDARGGAFTGYWARQQVGEASVDLPGPADPALLAMANRALCEQLDEANRRAEEAEAERDAAQSHDDRVRTDALEDAAALCERPRCRQWTPEECAVQIRTQLIRDRRDKLDPKEKP